MAFARPTVVALLMFALAAPFANALAQARAPVLVDRMGEVPDLLQTDPALKLRAKGDQYCAPVAVSNSLVWLAGRGYPELIPNGGERDLPRTLAGREFMDTGARTGTGAGALMQGLARYLDATSYRYELEYQGWRRMPSRFTPRRLSPGLDWLKSGLAGDSGVWLHVGWYDFDPSKDEYRRLHGHWVTLVGYGQRGDGAPDPNTVIIHDPSPRAGTTPSNEFVELAPIKSGTLVGSYRGLPLPAAGFFEMAGGMHVRKDATAAILDGVVVLRLAPASSSQASAR